MTDMVERLNTVVKYAQHGVDPYWVEIANGEIQRLRALIHDFSAAYFGDILCVCEYLDCVCEEDAYRAATKALVLESDTWNGGTKDV
jgi:hypothetical protein